ncbi:ABC transporter permease [Xylanimonas protaetiae]|uniref:ABC transporter permease n=1 Tax=Xylanimonas protaetiae TaxID=2509457 RepID=UPI0013EC5AAF|nr:ABC transporter permease [Xylanimonas protaetiae]
MPSPSRATLRTDTDEPRRGPGARFRGRWRVALRYGARDARRHKGRTALVAVMVALPVAVGSFAATALWSLSYAPEIKIRTELGSEFTAGLSFQGPGYLQAPDGSTGLGVEQRGPVAVADLEAGVSAALPAGSTLHRAAKAQLGVVGTDRRLSGTALQLDLEFPEAAAAFPVRDGALPQDGEVAITASMARQIGISLGDEVTLTPNRLAADQTTRTATVSGLLKNTQVIDASILLPATGPLVAPTDVGDTAADGQGGTQPEPRWFVTGDAPVTWEDVVAMNKLGVRVVSRAVLSDPPPDEAVPFYDEIPPESLGASVETWGTAAAVVAIALLEAVLLIGPSFAVSARRSARSLAIVAANGGTVRTLRAVVLGTGIVIGVLAALGGAVLGLAGTTVLVSVLADGFVLPVVPWLPVLAIVVVGVLLAAAGAWLPARGASKADVVAVLAGRRGETTHRRGPAVVGAVLAAAGFGGALAAGVAGQAMLLAAGIVVGQIGLVLACGGIVALLGRVAGRLPLSWRFALRDAARNRSRTAPAIAAVLVACAGASAGLVYSYSQALYDYRNQSIEARPGTLMIAPEAWPSPGNRLTTFDETIVAKVSELVADVIPDAGDLTPVRVLRTPGDAETVRRVDLVLALTDMQGPGMSSGPGGILGPVVDDGALVDVFAIPDADAAKDALRDGRLVTSPWGLAPDGTARLSELGVDSATDTPIDDGREVTAQGTAVGELVGPSILSLPLVPPQVAEANDLPVSVGGLVATPSATPSRAQVETLQSRLDDVYGETEWGGCIVCVGVAEPPQLTSGWLTTLLILGGTGLLALAAAWIAAALAATEARPDLATLAAVGAAPTTRKRIVAAQAGTIVVIGAVLGLTSGIAVGAAFVLQSRFRYLEDPTWSVVVPWLPIAVAVVALPLVAVGAAWLVTRGRLALTRRVAG